MPVDRLAMRRTLFEVAATQAGYFTAAQACDVGYSYQAHYYHVTRGNWLKIDRGLFRLAEWAAGPGDDLARWSLWAGSESAISHESALDVHGIGEFSPTRVHLTVPKGFTKTGTGVVIHHADLDPSTVQSQGSYQVTTPIRSLVDVAAAGVDGDQLERAIEDARELGLITVRQLREQAETIDMKGALRIEQALSKLGV